MNVTIQSGEVSTLKTHKTDIKYGKHANLGQRSYEANESLGKKQTLTH